MGDIGEDTCVQHLEASIRIRLADAKLAWFCF